MDSSLPCDERPPLPLLFFQSWVRGEANALAVSVTGTLSLTYPQLTCRGYVLWKGHWDRDHPNLINTDKWSHSISLRLAFISGAQIDGWEKWISASSLVSSFHFWVFQALNVIHWWGGSTAQRASVVTSVLMMGNQECNKDLLSRVIFP